MSVKVSAVFVVIHIVFGCVHGAGFESIKDGSKIETKEWCYTVGECLDTTWGDHCETTKFPQSPLNIVSEQITEQGETIVLPKDILLDGFQLRYKGRALGIAVIGKQVEFKWQKYCDGQYVLSGLHFHTGGHDDVGSEHTINGRSFPIELHMVYWCSKFPTIDDAILSLEKGAILVISVFLETEGDVPAGDTSDFLEPVVKHLTGGLATDPAKDYLNLSAIHQGKKGYIYSGSFTTPPCSPANWLILSRPVVIPKAHLKVLRSPYFGTSIVNLDNFRHLAQMKAEHNIQTVTIETG